eukprot:5756174-Pleurochrysis_carterae.AAC.5
MPRSSFTTQTPVCPLCERTGAQTPQALGSSITQRVRRADATPAQTSALCEHASRLAHLRCKRGPQAHGGPCRDSTYMSNSTSTRMQRVAVGSATGCLFKAAVGSCYKSMAFYRNKALPSICAPEQPMPGSALNNHPRPVVPAR